ncbi:3'-5' exonuclease [Methyloversatilis sp.]|uniref:3'-5' exonuclease n=1 Tax=Methyloversatilis sp. TaxID=2569862 RepID=UPI002732AB36|nr:3'-5' exonuclease [Methyloversatilis sp.]MDP2870386.1 3'-5' exonuclease [Methyloversatilis sp.]MDP3289757.1 3'-5' exonuclease [Methyloversatilis sp.]MDP3457103.1 3'-5' exonuclease [Methyloversatilis sp.]MDP3576810.1 3'-5' exonuclease [Methyloversatilis sp.]
MRKTAPSKAETDLLPVFPGVPPDCIHVPATPAAFAAAAEHIRAARQVGFDTESKPTFKVGEASTGPHVVQFALTDCAYVFQLHHRDCWPVLADLLHDEDVLKIGFGLSSDRSQVLAKLGVVARGLVDLDRVFRKQGYNNSIGVRAAVGVVLGQNFRKSKSVTTSNWSLPVLSPAQVLYAANDAWAALKVFEALGLPADDPLFRG